jgi:hypothetical protein
VSPAGGRLLLANSQKQKNFLFRGLSLGHGKRYAVFFYFQAEGLEANESQMVNVVLRDSETKRVKGGSQYRVVLEPQDVQAEKYNGNDDGTLKSDGIL